MPSFELPCDSATLTFTGRYAGAEVEVKIDVSLKDFLAMDEIQEKEGLPGVLAKFGDDIVQSWNLTIKGKSLPATGNGMMQLSPAFGLAIVQAWRGVIAAPPGPLAGLSSNGSGDLEESLNLADSSKPV